MSISAVKQPLDWDEFRLFLAVARAAGLNRAARLVGASAPTLGRRMNELEGRLNRRLFVRRQTGYELTEAGRELYAHALDMEAIANDVDRWRDESAARRLVRISAGSWTSRFLAQNMRELQGDDRNLAIELSTAHQRVDILRRQAEIGIRNRAPEERRLAGRRINRVAYAVYRPAGAGEELPWIVVTGDAAITPSARWLAQRASGRTGVIVSDPRAVLDCVRAGAGRGVLPCFVGDTEPGVERQGDPIVELQEEQWLVLNEQGRREPAVRAVIDRVAALLLRHRAMFEGRARESGPQKRRRARRETGSGVARFRPK